MLVLVLSFQSLPESGRYIIQQLTLSLSIKVIHCVFIPLLVLWCYVEYNTMSKLCQIILHLISSNTDTARITAASNTESSNIPFCVSLQYLLSWVLSLSVWCKAAINFCLAEPEKKLSKEKHSTFIQEAITQTATS